MNQTPQQNPQQQSEHESAPEQRPLGTRTALSIVAVAVVVTVVLAVIGILARKHSAEELAETMTSLASPTVTVASAKPGAAVDSFVLPADVTPFTDSPIYARTSGYLTRWYFDLGARVKKGAVLAEISTPEVDQQMAQAEADLATAEANARNARLQADRYTGLVQSNAVSRQETETLVSQAAATAAVVRSAQANLARLRDLKSFQRVVAPFDGIVTARNADVGQLIAPGTGRELFHMQAILTLRVFVNLPQAYAAAAKNGTKVDLTFTEKPGRTFTGTLVRSSGAIDPASRTMLTEIDLDNRAGEILPGTLAQAHFKSPSAAQSLIVPVSALIFRREGMRVGVVGPGDVAHLAAVVIGEDDGASVQIVQGITASDRVIQDPPDSLIDGEKVQVVPAPAGGK